MKHLQIIGNLGSDATASKDNKDNYNIHFNVAVSEKYKDAQGVELQNTDWITVFVKRKTVGKVMDYLKKGTQISVWGKPTFQIREYQGEKRLQITVNNAQFQLLSSPNE